MNDLGLWVRVSPIGFRHCHQHVPTSVPAGLVSRKTDLGARDAEFLGEELKLPKDLHWCVKGPPWTLNRVWQHRTPIHKSSCLPGNGPRDFGTARPVGRRSMDCHQIVTFRTGNWAVATGVSLRDGGSFRDGERNPGNLGVAPYEDSRETVFQGGLLPENAECLVRLRNGRLLHLNDCVAFPDPAIGGGASR